MQVNDVPYLEKPGGGMGRERKGGEREKDCEVAVEILDMRVGPTLTSPGTPTVCTLRGENNS